MKQTFHSSPVPVEKRKLNKANVLMAILLLLALAAAITFGILWAVEKNKASEPAPEVVEDCNCASDDNSAVVSGPYISEGYLYVPEWGIKYQLDNSLIEYGFAVTQDSLANGFGKYSIGLTAVDKDDMVERPQARYYDDIGTCSIISVTKTDQDVSNIHGPRKIVESDTGTYVVYDYSSHNSCSYTKNLEEIAEKLTNVVSNPIPF